MMMWLCAFWMAAIWALWMSESKFLVCRTRGRPWWRQRDTPLPVHRQTAANQLGLWTLVIARTPVAGCASARFRCVRGGLFRPWRSPGDGSGVRAAWCRRGQHLFLLHRHRRRCFHQAEDKQAGKQEPQQAEHYQVGEKPGDGGREQINRHRQSSDQQIRVKDRSQGAALRGALAAWLLFEYGQTFTKRSPIHGTLRQARLDVSDSGQ